MNPIVQGASLIIPMQRMSADGVTPASGYQSSDVLSCRMWPGGDHTVVATPTAYWTNVAVAQFSIAFQPADTATLDPDIYSIQVVCARDGIPTILVDDRIEITAAPGLATQHAVYISYSMLRNVVPDVVSLLSNRDETGFQNERAEARLWLDENTHRHNDGAANIQSDMAALAYAYRWPGYSPTMIRWLANDWLVLSQPLVRAQCYYTLSLIYSGRELSNPTLYADMSKKYQIKAENTLRCATAQIMSGGTKRWYPYGGCYDGTLLSLVDYSGTIRLRG